jgi:seryl-tRNA synthetase
MPKDKIMEEIKKNLKEVTEKQKELAESQKRTDKEITKLAESQKRTDKEIARLTEKTDKEIKDLSKEVDRVSKEVEKVNKMVGDLTDGWGKFVIGLTELSISSINGCFKDLGFEVIRVDSPPPARIAGKELEVDLLVVTRLNGKPYVAVIDVKSYINQQKIEEFIKKRLQRFKDFFFEYKNIDLIGGVAGVRFARGAKDYAINCGLYLFGTSQGIMVNLTPAEFKPKVW